MREKCSRPRRALTGPGAMGGKIALITDGRFSGATPRLLYRPCRAGRPPIGGPIALLAGWRHHPKSTPFVGTLKRKIDPTRNWPNVKPNGGLARQTIRPVRCGSMPQQVGPAVDGAVTHPGGAAREKQCYGGYLSS